METIKGKGERAKAVDYPGEKTGDEGIDVSFGEYKNARGRNDGNDKKEEKFEQISGFFQRRTERQKEPGGEGGVDYGCEQE
ncbi:MAG: hypothetical protein WCE45_11360 [Sedimentisphaerales bacterium]